MFSWISISHHQTVIAMHSSLLLSDLTLRMRSMIWWILGVFLTVLVVDAFYPSIVGDPALNSMVDQMPEALRPLLGPADLTSPVGYLASQLYLFFLPAIVLILAIGRGAASIAGEEEDHTLDLLMVQPIGRWSLFSQKAGAVIILMVVIAFVSVLPTLALGPSLDIEIPVANLLAVTGQLAVMTVLFAMLAFAVGAATGHRSVAIAISAAVAFVSYLVDGLGQTIDWLDTFRPLTPWYWFAPVDALTDGWQIGGMAILIGASVFLVVLGGWLFGRRNLRA